MKIFPLTVTVAALILSLSPRSARAADCAVTNANDAGAGSLRACLAQATADGDVVTIGPEVTSPILLTTGALNIDAGISIVGAGPGVSVIDGSGNGNNRMITLDASVTGKSVSISGLTIQGGNLSADGSAILVDRNFLALSDCILQNNRSNGANGGAVMVAGTEASLTVTNCQFLGNSVQGAGNGGAIYSNGSLFLNNSTFSENGTQAGQNGKGGAVYLNSGVGQVLNSTFSRNSADGDGGAFYNSSFNDVVIENSLFDGNRNLNGIGVGGAIYNERESMILSDSDFTANTVGGAIFNEGLLVADSCYFSGNSSANFDGGAIQNDHILVLQNSLVTDNSVSPGHGGGVYVNGLALILNSTIANNSSDFDGGGLYVSPGSNTVTIDNSTFFGNEAAGNGGGIFGGETTVLNNVTVTANSAASGGGIYTQFETYFSNSILAGNNAGSGPDCFYFAGLFIANGPNLVQNPAGCVFTGDVQDAINESPNLAAELAANGGPAIGQNGSQAFLTLALQPGSPALDAGDDASCLPVDQRGVSRPQGGACDLGAFEAGATAELSASQLTFEEQIVGTASEAQTASLANNGQIPLVVTGVTVDGDVEDFIVENGCEAELAPGESCELSVVFEPTANALRQATITLDTSSGPRSIALLGAGILPSGGGDGGGCSLGSSAGGPWSTVLGMILGLAALLALRGRAPQRSRR